MLITFMKVLKDIGGKVGGLIEAGLWLRAMINFRMRLYLVLQGNQFWLKAEWPIREL